MNKQLKILLWKALAFINPGSWIALKKYDRTLDLWLFQQLASSAPLEIHDYYSATLGGVKLWVANTPYCCGYPYEYCHGEHKYRPSRGAMLWLAFRVKWESEVRHQPDARQRKKLHEAIGKGWR